MKEVIEMAKNEQKLSLFLKSRKKLFTHDEHNVNLINDIADDYDVKVYSDLSHLFYHVLKIEQLNELLKIENEQLNKIANENINMDIIRTTLKMHGVEIGEDADIKLAKIED